MSKSGRLRRLLFGKAAGALLVILAIALAVCIVGLVLGEIRVHA